MPDITLTIPTKQVTRVIHALCVAGGQTVENPANARKTVIDFIKATVANVEVSEAEQAMRDQIVEPDIEGVVT